MKKKACKNCRIMVEEGKSCPICKKENTSTNWQGRVHFLQPEKSVIAHKMNIEHKGEYAIKVR